MNTGKILLEDSEPCLYCERGTSPGSGLWVDRIPADDGWMCRECQVCDEPESCYHDECVELREDD